jgi:hypothetical protein
MESFAEKSSRIMREYRIIKRPKTYLSLGSQSGDYLLKCDAIQSGMSSLSHFGGTFCFHFQDKRVSQGRMKQVGIGLLGSLFESKYGGCTFFQIVGQLHGVTCQKIVGGYIEAGIVEEINKESGREEDRNKQK